MEGRQAKDHKVDQPPQKASIRIFFDIGFNVNRGYTSMQLLTAIKQHVSSTRNDIGQECTPETYPHCISFMGMVTDKHHRDDKTNLHNAQRPRDFAAHFWPACWVVVGAGSESKWTYDRWLTENLKGEFNGRVQTFTVAPARIAKIAELVTGTATANGTFLPRRWQAASSCCAADGGLGEQHVVAGYLRRCQSRARGS